MFKFIGVYWKGKIKDQLEALNRSNKSLFQEVINCHLRKQEVKD